MSSGWGQPALAFAPPRPAARARATPGPFPAAPAAAGAPGPDTPARPVASAAARGAGAAAGGTRAAPPATVAAGGTRATARASGAAAWAHALRVGSLPATLLGPAVAALLAVGAPRVHLAALGVVVALLVVGHALAALARDLGAARGDHVGLLPRPHAGRAVLGLAGAAVALLGVLAGARGAVALAAALGGPVVVLLAISRRSGPIATALAGVGAGCGSLLVSLDAALGRLPLAAVPPSLVVGGLVAAGLLGRRRAVGPAAARALVALPHAVVGIGVALAVLPWPAVAVGLALPAGRRAVEAVDRRRGVVAHARLVAVVLLAALALAAARGPLPLVT